MSPVIFTDLHFERLVEREKETSLFPVFGIECIKQVDHALKQLRVFHVVGRGFLLIKIIFVRQKNESRRGRKVSKMSGEMPLRHVYIKKNDVRLGPAPRERFGQGARDIKVLTILYTRLSASCKSSIN